MNSVEVRVEMLIRRPVSDVFDAVVNPEMLEKFWLKSASGPLALGTHIDWEFMVPGVRETVTVTEFIQDQIIDFLWSDGIAVKMAFVAYDTSSVRLMVTVAGFSGADPALQAVKTAEGFTIVLCDLKSLLETGKSGNMVRDKAVLISADKAEA